MRDEGVKFSTLMGIIAHFTGHLLKCCLKANFKFKPLPPSVLGKNTALNKLVD